jgi:quercetin dioxygenase-like cupin family protein
MRAVAAFGAGVAIALLAAAAQAMPQVRLTPAEIEGLTTTAGGTGTSGVAGIQTTVLSGDPKAAGPYTIVLSVPPNTRIAAHTHRDDRASVVVSGQWYFGYGTVAEASKLKVLGPGGFYTEPAGQPHFAQTHDQPAVVYVSGFGPSDTVFEAAPSGK